MEIFCISTASCIKSIFASIQDKPTSLVETCIQHSEINSLSPKTLSSALNQENLLKGKQIVYLVSFCLGLHWSIVCTYFLVYCYCSYIMVNGKCDRLNVSRNSDLIQWLFDLQVLNI